MPDLKIVELNKTSLLDVPTQLRQLADEIEVSDYKSNLVVVVRKIDHEDYPLIYGFGKGADDTPNAVMELELAKMFLLNNIVRRS